MDTKKQKILDEKLRAYFDANAAKNAANNLETKLKKEIAFLMQDETEKYSLAITNKVTLVAGEHTDTDFEIDAKLVQKNYPDEFWQVISIAKGRATEILGEKGATKCSVEVEKTGFAIKKVK